MNYINEALSKLDRMSKDKSYKCNPRVIKEAKEDEGGLEITGDVARVLPSYNHRETVKMLAIPRSALMNKGLKELHLEECPEDFISIGAGSSTGNEGCKVFGRDGLNVFFWPSDKALFDNIITSVREGCEGDECKETCEGEDCGAYSGKDRLDEWVTPGHSARWKRLETLADIEAWAKEVKEETGKEPKWYISNPAFDNREQIFKNYIKDGKVFVGGTHGVYGGDGEYFLGLAKPASEENKSLCELELVSAYDINDKPLSTVLIGNGNGGKSIWPKDGDKE